MATPDSPISLDDVNIEITSRSSGDNISMNDSDVRDLAGKPGSGNIISMNDLRNKSVSQWGSITNNVSSSTSEGTTVTFTVNGTGIPDGSYSWSVYGITGNLSTGDFSPYSGTFTMSSDSGSFQITILADSSFTTSGSFSVEVGGAAIVSGYVTVTEGAVASASGTPETLRYGYDVLSARNCTVSINTNVANATVYWRVNTLTQSEDVSQYSVNGGAYTNMPSSMEGSLGLNGSGNGTLVLVMYHYTSFIGSRTFSVTFYSDSGRTAEIASTGNLTLSASIGMVVSGSENAVTLGVDNATWTGWPNNFIVNEGDQFIIKLTTTNVSSGEGIAFTTVSGGEEIGLPNQQFNFPVSSTPANGDFAWFNYTGTLTAATDGDTARTSTVMSFQIKNSSGTYVNMGGLVLAFNNNTIYVDP